MVSDVTGNNPYWLGAVALALLAAAYIGESSAPVSRASRPGAAGGLACDRLLLRTVDAAGGDPQGVRRVLPALMNQFISLIKDSSLVYFLGLLASQRELFAVGRDLNAQTATCRRWSPRVWCICC